jgi:2-aminoethylphosphonate-pyruvate transaminase
MDKKLLTPGPLTTSLSTKEAMLHDWGSRDINFIELNRDIRQSLIALINGQNVFECVPMQGSGTFAVEAMIGSLTNTKSKILILINGAYGQRMKKICSYMSRNCISYTVAEHEIHDCNKIENIIDDNKDLTHIFAVYCETTSGILNPIQTIADLAKKKERSLFIDAMSAFGALPLDVNKIHFDAVAASANKCLEGVPGVGFILIRKTVLELAKNNAHSLSLDLFDQWQAMEANAQWRFTPPTHVLAAFHQALKEHLKEGGVIGRYQRYKENCKIICEGMTAMGFKRLLPDELQAPIIITFIQPDHPNFKFKKFYDALSEKGYLIYPGKLTVADTFRIGCIGHLTSKDMHEVLDVVKETLKELDIKLN